MCIKSSSDEGFGADPTSQVAFMGNYLTQSSIESGINRDFLTCPVGVLLMLTTLFASGATRGETEKQLAVALKLKSAESDKTLLSAQAEARTLYKYLVSDLKSEETLLNTGKAKVMGIDNGLFIKSGYQISHTFQRSFLNEFSAHFQQLDFKNQSAAVHQINSWIYGASAGLIPRFFQSPDELRGDTRIALINVFTFKDHWDRAFIPHKTYSEEFMPTKDRRIGVTMMISEEEMKYATFEDKGFSMVRKHMRNPRFSLVILLPTDKWNMDGVNQVLNGRYTVKKLMESEEARFVSLKLPRFQLKKELNLIPILQKMGIEDLFDRNVADLSGVTTSERLFITLMKQAAILKVNEIGVEAAAVTGAVMAPTSLIRTEVNFHVTHPFVCMIYDEQLHIPLVSARVMEPSE